MEKNVEFFQKTYYLSQISMVFSYNTFLPIENPRVTPRDVGISININSVEEMVWFSEFVANLTTKIRYSFFFENTFFCFLQSVFVFEKKWFLP